MALNWVQFLKIFIKKSCLKFQSNGSGRSGKREMNGSGNGSRSSKKILDFNKVEAEAAILEAEAGLFQNSGSRSGSG